jgi:hypothetical protein
MRKAIKLFLVLIITLLITSTYHAQSGAHDLVIQGYDKTGHYLNDDILGDSTSFGTRKDPDRVYILQRGSIYFVNVSIQNVNWILRIKGATGTGAKPIIYSYKNATTGKYPSQILNPRNDVYLTDVAMVGYSEFLTDEIKATLAARIIYSDANGISLYVDNCVLSGANSTLMQTNNAAHVVKVTNSTLAYCGNLWGTNIGNGRGVDFRNISVDSAIFRNNTFMYFTDRIIRHYASTGAISSFIFDHNTVLNTLSEHGHIALGWFKGSAVITNNLELDNFALGNDSTDSVRLTEFIDSGEKGPTGKYLMTFVSCIPDSAGKSSTTWTVRNNYYSVSAALQSFYNSHSNIGLGNLMPLTHFINKKIGADSTKAYAKETSSIVFTKAPRDVSSFANWYWQPNPTGPNKQKTNTGFSYAIDFEHHQVAYLTDTLNLRYQTTAKAYTGADKGLPAGDVRWWGLTLGIEKSSDIIPTTFSLEQNYPNPFNPATKIVYNIPVGSNVKLEVFDILGRKVVTLVDQFQQTGQYRVDFNGTRLSSGVYIYKLSSQNYSIAKKMMLIK